MRNHQAGDEFAEADEQQSEKIDFHAIAGDHHGRVNPCFMTGKGCVYSEQIDQSLKQGNCSGFMVMPFRPKLGVFYKNCLQPFFDRNYGIDGNSSSLEYGRGSGSVLERADEVSRPGIIICEGICKRIQESNFIVADISVQNDNVFYELGLAYGIGQKIVLIHQHGAAFGRDIAEYFVGEDHEKVVYL